MLACQEPVTSGMQIRRINGTTVRPTYYQDKSWQKIETKNGDVPRRSRKEKFERSVEDMKRDGEAYSVSSGVGLKFDAAESAEDAALLGKITWENEEHIVIRYVKSSFSIFDRFRCMRKFPNTVPSELGLHKIRNYVEALPEFIPVPEPGDEVLISIKEKWQEAYAENLERVTFDNLSSYEP